MSRQWPGWLIVLEGADGCGRSTQTAMLKAWLERRGYAVVETGLRRSALAGDLISRAKHGNRLGRVTMSLLYATDLADELENRVLPALRAGSIVLADRYIYALMARALARGGEQDWLDELLGFAPQPDLTLYLQTTPEERLQRSLAKDPHLDYWESGMDLGLSPDRFISCLQYQNLLQAQYEVLAARYGFVKVDGAAARNEIQEQLREAVRHLLEGGEELAGA